MGPVPPQESVRASKCRFTNLRSDLHVCVCRVTPNLRALVPAGSDDSARQRALETAAATWAARLRDTSLAVVNGRPAANASLLRAVCKASTQRALATRRWSIIGRRSPRCGGMRLNLCSVRACGVQPSSALLVRRRRACRVGRPWKSSGDGARHSRGGGCAARLCHGRGSGRMPGR